MNNAKNSKGIVPRAEPSGDAGSYQEIAVRAFRKGKTIAYILVGLDRCGNLHVLVTANGDGDGEHAVAVYPEKPKDRGNISEV